MNPDDAAVCRAWRAVPTEVRQDAVRLARAGTPHPDAKVRGAADAWARVVLRRRPWGLVGLCAVVVGTLVWTAFGGGGVSDVDKPSDRNSIARRREAQLILAASHVPSTPGPAAPSGA